MSGSDVKREGCRRCGGEVAPFVRGGRWDSRPRSCCERCWAVHPWNTVDTAEADRPRRVPRVLPDRDDADAPGLDTPGPLLAALYLPDVEAEGDAPGVCGRCAAAMPVLPPRRQRVWDGTDADLLWSARAVVCAACYAAYARELAARSAALAAAEEARAAAEPSRAWTDEQRAIVAQALAEGARVRALALALRANPETVAACRLVAPARAPRNPAHAPGPELPAYARTIAREVRAVYLAEVAASDAAIDRCLLALGRPLGLRVTSAEVACDTREHQADQRADQRAAWLAAPAATGEKLRRIVSRAGEGLRSWDLADRETLADGEEAAREPDAPSADRPLGTRSADA